MTGKVLQFEYPIICALDVCEEEIIGAAVQHQGVFWHVYAHSDCNEGYVFQQEMQGDLSCGDLGINVFIKPAKKS